MPTVKTTPLLDAPSDPMDLCSLTPRQIDILNCTRDKTLSMLLNTPFGRMSVLRQNKVLEIYLESPGAKTAQDGRIVLGSKMGLLGQFRVHTRVPKSGEAGVRELCGLLESRLGVLAKTRTDFLNSLLVALSKAYLNRNVYSYEPKKGWIFTHNYVRRLDPSLQGRFDLINRNQSYDTSVEPYYQLKLRGLPDSFWEAICVVLPCGTFSPLPSRIMVSPIQATAHARLAQTRSTANMAEQLGLDWQALLQANGLNAQLEADFQGFPT